MKNKKQINLEYSVNTIPKILYYRLINPSGLEEWFADKVTVDKNQYNFKWAKSEQNALLIEKKTNEFVKYCWEGNKKDCYFEFRIKSQEVTQDISLHITDFAYEDEFDEIVDMWDEQVSNLKYRLGV